MDEDCAVILCTEEEPENIPERKPITMSSRQILVNIGYGRKKVFLLNDRNTLSQQFINYVKADPAFSKLLDQCDPIFQEYNEKFETWVDVDSEENLHDGSVVKAVFFPKTVAPDEKSRGSIKLKRNVYDSEPRQYKYRRVKEDNKLMSSALFNGSETVTPRESFLGDFWEPPLQNSTPHEVCDETKNVLCNILNSDDRHQPFQNNTPDKNFNYGSPHSIHHNNKIIVKENVCEKENQWIRRATMQNLSPKMSDNLKSSFNAFEHHESITGRELLPQNQPIRKRPVKERLGYIVQGNGTATDLQLQNQFNNNIPMQETLDGTLQENGTSIANLQQNQPTVKPTVTLRRVETEKSRWYLMPKENNIDKESVPSNPPTRPSGVSTFTNRPLHPRVTWNNEEYYANQKAPTTKIEPSASQVIRSRRSYQSTYTGETFQAKGKEVIEICHQSFNAQLSLPVLDSAIATTSYEPRICYVSLSGYIYIRSDVVREQRLQWGRNNTSKNWYNTIFSGIAVFSVVENKIVRKYHCDMNSETLYGCLTFDGPKIFAHVGKSLTNPKLYRILKNQVIHFVKDAYHNEQVTLQIFNDTLTQHQSNSAKAILKENYIDVVNWPTFLKDISPMEHLWDLLAKKVNNIPCSSRVQMNSIITDVWKKDEDIHSLCRSFVTSFPKIINSLIQENGQSPKFTVSWE